MTEIRELLVRFGNECGAEFSISSSSSWRMEEVDKALNFIDSDINPWFAKETIKELSKAKGCDKWRCVLYLINENVTNLAVLFNCVEENINVDQYGNPYTKEELFLHNIKANKIRTSLKKFPQRVIFMNNYITDLKKSFEMFRPVYDSLLKFIHVFPDNDDLMETLMEFNVIFRFLKALPKGASFEKNEKLIVKWSPINFLNMPTDLEDFNDYQNFFKPFVDDFCNIPETKASKKENDRAKADTKNIVKNLFLSRIYSNTTKDDEDNYWEKMGKEFGKKLVYENLCHQLAEKIVTKSSDKLYLYDLRDIVIWIKYKFIDEKDLQGTLNVNKRMQDTCDQYDLLLDLIDGSEKSATHFFRSNHSIAYHVVKHYYKLRTKSHFKDDNLVKLLLPRFPINIAKKDGTKIKGCLKFYLENVADFIFDKANKEEYKVPIHNTRTTSYLTISYEKDDIKGFKYSSRVKTIFYQKQQVKNSSN